MHAKLTLSLLVLSAACATSSKVERPVVPPIPETTTAYEAAATVQLAERKPEEFPGLHNVYRLSDDIVSGAEPEGEEAFQQLQAMGIKTILSVDGKEPDHETAARYGIRYVHVPIRYSGIEPDELNTIAKTFRELDGPFYTHCFHGKHRGPAAAAVGRVVRDGASREAALAEMRQWCGTSKSYEGLYATIAFGDLPTAEQTAEFGFDFPEAHRLTGFRHAMIELPRSWDVVEALSKRDWKPEDSHPDASAANEAAKAHEIFAATLQMDDFATHPADFQDWLRRSEQESRTLAELLMAHSRGDADAGEQAKAAAKRVKALCSDCHGKYRN